jgi:esterase/lipase superfamily enzyme
LQSIEPAKQVFRELASLWIPVQVVVHSMGHEVALPSIARLAPEIGRPWIQELLLNAPDFDPSEFVQMASALRASASRITLYCSDKDHAMTASQKVHHQERLGACTRQEGVDVVNVSEVDDPGFTGLGHGYYASRPVLTDVRQVLFGIGAKQRLFIRKAPEGARSDYVLRK